MTPHFNEHSETWQAVCLHLKEQKDTLILELIEKESPIVRAKIQAINELLDLPTYIHLKNGH